MRCRPSRGNARDIAASAVTDVRRIPWRSISAWASSSSRSAWVVEVLQHRDEKVERADLGAGAVGDDPDEPEVVEVLVGDHDPLELLDPMTVRREGLLERDERPAGVRADVDQRERVVLDQVAVDRPDPERGGDRQALDRGHERISARISSRRCSMSCWEIRLSRLSRSSGSVFEGRTLKCQSG